jgi:hypothetical protein
MQAIRRLLPIFHVAVCLVIALVVINEAMVKVADAYPNWLPYHMEGTGFTEDISQRVAAAERRYPADAARGQYLCAMLGLSSFREGLDLHEMTEATGGRCRFLGLCGAGPSLEDIPDQSEALRAGSLRPDLVVIGINEFHQAKPTAAVAAANSRRRVTLREAFLHGDVRNVMKYYRDRFWFYDRRQDVSLESESILLAGKVKILRAMGAHIDNPTTDPWREMIHLDAPDKASAATFREQLASYKVRGLFEPGTYTSATAAQQRGRLVELIRDSQARGAKVVVVLMPEYSELRRRVPAIARRMLRTGLRLGLGENAPPILDLRSALDDGSFSDISHMNSEGRTAFSRLLAPKIVAYLPTNRPPLMATPQ